MIKNRIPAYNEILSALSNSSSLGGVTDEISAISAVRITLEWETAQSKVLMLGQETGALEFSLEEMAASIGEIEKVASSYEWFDFAEGKDQRSSPFWRAHRRLAIDLEDGDYRSVMWSNLVKVQSSLKTGSGIHRINREHIGRVIDWQSDIVRSEIRDLAPKAIVLFTGPRYDWIIQRVFPAVQFSAVDGSLAPVRTLARVTHPDLPLLTIRTYHPAYMQRSGQTALLDDVLRFLSPA